MNKFNLAILVRTTLTSHKRKFVPTSSRWYSKNEDDNSKSDDGKLTNKNEDEHQIRENQKARLAKLNSLLKDMIEDSPQKTEPIEFARPTPKFGKYRKMLQEIKTVEPPKATEQTIVTAAKEVAETIGGNTKETEAELLRKLFGNKDGESDAISNLSDIFKGMKIDRSTPTEREQQSRSEQVRNILRQTSAPKQPRQERPRRKFSKPVKKQRITQLDNIDLYGSEPLGIFTRDLNEYSEHVTNKTWEALNEREMKLMVTHPPSNYFQEMILWTEQGKLWKFPIDNEQGLEEEKEVSFAEHIFLDKHLEPWCPPRGPIRHFMELVCIGLSKNPYLTVGAKIEHIEWYRNYFEDKRQLLKEVGSPLNEYEPKKEINSK